MILLIMVMIGRWPIRRVGTGDGRHPATDFC
jgi:hypothetical protein